MNKTLGKHLYEKVSIYPSILSCTSRRLSQSNMPSCNQSHFGVILGIFRLNFQLVLCPDVIVVKEVVIAGPEITYEFAGGGGSNFDAIKRNVDAYAKQMGAGGGGGAPQQSSEAEGGKKVIIEHLYVRNGKIGVSADFLQGKALNAPLPTIHLKDIGKKSNGATAAEVAEQLIGEISKSATMLDH